MHDAKLCMLRASITYPNPQDEDCLETEDQTPWRDFETVPRSVEAETEDDAVTTRERSVQAIAATLSNSTGNTMACVNFASVAQHLCATCYMKTASVDKAKQPISRPQDA
jgi:hypothetical protein